MSSTAGISGRLERLHHDDAGFGQRSVVTPQEMIGAFADLARPPVLGLVEPERELNRVLAELHELEATTV